jgi:hypothetical protein
MNLQQIEKKLLDKTQYGGNKEPMVKAISASELGNDLLQIYLRYKYGVPDSTEFGQDTIGSLMHIALQDILKDEYEVEKKYQYQFSNNWFLTGSIEYSILCGTYTSYKVSPTNNNSNFKTSTF